MPSSRRGLQSDHVVEQQLSGGHAREKHGMVPHRRPPTRKPPALHVIPPDWQPREGVPATRDECRGKERACPFVRCRHHLWLKLSEDRDGRRAPNGKKAPTVLYPTSETSCALAIAERGQGMTCREVGEILGITDERVRQLEKRALAKLREHAEDLGMSPDALLAELTHAAAHAAARDKVDQRPLRAELTDEEVSDEAHRDEVGSLMRADSLDGRRPWERL